MGKKIVDIALFVIVSLSLASSTAGFDNNPNKIDPENKKGADLRSYSKDIASKPVDKNNWLQGGYYGGHDTITNEAVILKKAVHGNNQQFKDWADKEALQPFRIGTHDEDTTQITIDVPIVTSYPSLNLSYPVDIELDKVPMGSLGHGKFFDHFYDPAQSDRGFKGHNTSAVQKANDYIKEISKIAGCATGGINASGNDNIKEKIYQYFGRAMHLLQDMSVPSHVTDDAHPFRKNYEKYINDHWDEIVNAPSFLQKVTPENYMSGNYRFESVEKAMKSLAEKSRTYPNEEQVYECIDDPNTGMRFCGPSQEKLKNNAAALVPEAIMYTAGFIDSIYDYISGNTSDQAKCAVLYHFLGPGGDHPDDRFDVSDGFYWENQFGVNELDFADLSALTTS